MNYKLKKDLPNLKAGAIFEPDSIGNYISHHIPYYACQVENNSEWFEPVPDTVTLPREVYESMMNDLKSAVERREKSNEYIKNLEARITALESKAEYWIKLASTRSKRILELENILILTKEDDTTSDCKVNVPSGYTLIQDGKHVKWSDDDMLNFAAYITDSHKIKQQLHQYATNKQH